MSTPGTCQGKEFRNTPVEECALDERGATATEYSLLTGFISLVIVTGVGIFGIALNDLFGAFTNGLKAALGLP